MIEDDELRKVKILWIAFITGNIITIIFLITVIAFFNIMVAVVCIIAFGLFIAYVMSLYKSLTTANEGEIITD